MLSVLLICRVVGVVDLSHCWCWCQSVTLIVLLLVRSITTFVIVLLHYSQVPTWNPLCCCSFALFLCIASCYFYYMCLGEVLPPSHHLVGGKLVVHWVTIHLPLPSTHHCHLPSLVMLLVCCIIGVTVGSLCYLCHGDFYYPLTLPYTSGGAFMQWKIKGKKVASFHLKIK